MRYLMIALSLLLCPAAASLAGVSVSIGIGVPAYPSLELIPGYPVYYAPQLGANYFFYDGLYWVFEDDAWYVSSWFDGPWEAVDPLSVPAYILRIPVRYYRHPPPFFHGWRADAPPRWGEHWGHDWDERRHGWGHWNRHAAPPPAPLPRYQQQFQGERYPHSVEQQHGIQAPNYHYQPHEPIARQHLTPPAVPHGEPHQMQREQLPPGQQEHGRKHRPEWPEQGDQ